MLSIDLRVPLPQRMIDFVVRNVVGVFFFLQALALLTMALLTMALLTMAMALDVRGRDLV